MMVSNVPAGRTPYCGVVIPMLTPFTPQGELDEAAVRRVIDHLAAGGVAGIFILGTTGEAASIPAAMKVRLAELTVEHTAGRALVYAGISHNCLANSVEAAEVFFKLGVDVAVAHLPSYYELNAAEQEAYYQALSRAVAGPLMLYNIPSTTHMTIPLEVVARLSAIQNIVGLKDSQNDIARLGQALEWRSERPDFAILTGVTSLSAQALRLGADGSVPSLGNLTPALCQRLYEAVLQGDDACVDVCQQQLDELGKLLRGSLSLAQSLWSQKVGMSALGLCGPDVLPPLQALSAAQEQQIKASFTAWLGKVQ